MKLSIACAATAALLATNYATAFRNPKVTNMPPPKAAEVDNAMSQYEAALKAAFEQASATAVPSPENQQQELGFPVVKPAWSPNNFDEVEEQEQAIDQYGTALKAALEASSMAERATAPPSIVFGEQDKVTKKKQEQPDWANISGDITARIKMAESKLGAPLDASAKGEIIGTVLAGSAVLGTAAVNSPLLLGAALGYAGTHILGGERGEALAEASKEALTNAVAFTEAQIKEEKGDISRAGARIVEHLENEAIRKSQEVQKAAEMKAHEVARDISDAPSHLVDEGKKLVQSEDFQQMPKRTFKAVTAFLGSDKVKRARQKVVDSIKDGLESEEMQAMREKATRSLTNL